VHQLAVEEQVLPDGQVLATGCPFQAWSVAELLRIRRAGA